MGLIPSKAENEFTGDCFGVRNDPKKLACQLCQVILQCAVRTNAKRIARIEQPINLTKGINLDAPEQKTSINFYGRNQRWAVHRVIMATTGSFTSNKIIDEVILFCKMHRIKFGNVSRAVSLMLNKMRRLGIVKRDGHKSWCKVANAP